MTTATKSPAPVFHQRGEHANCAVFGQAWTGAVYLTNGKAADIARALRAAAAQGIEDLYVRLSTEAGAVCDCGACVFSYGWSSYADRDVWQTAGFPGGGGYLSTSVCEKACDQANAN